MLCFCEKTHMWAQLRGEGIIVLTKAPAPSPAVPPDLSSIPGLQGVLPMATCTPPRPRSDNPSANTRRRRTRPFTARHRGNRGSARCIVGSHADVCVWTLVAVQDPGRFPSERPPRSSSDRTVSSDTSGAGSGVLDPADLIQPQEVSSGPPERRRPKSDSAVFTSSSSSSSSDGSHLNLFERGSGTAGRNR